MTETRETIGLEQFLAGLPDEDAAAAREAAAEIDALERRIGPPGWIERNLISLGSIALALFLLGVLTLIGVLPTVRSIIGLSGVSLLVATFPALVSAYLYSVRGLTALDNRKMALNRRHFLPHGGLYFGAPEGSGKVLRVEQPERGEPDLRQRTYQQYEAATKRRWWW